MAVHGERDHVSATFARARENAITIGARTPELRIVNDMAEMAIAEGSNEKAVELLPSLYESFGGETVTEDLKRSARLLAEAAANRNPVPRRM